MLKTEALIIKIPNICTLRYKGGLRKQRPVYKICCPFNKSRKYLLSGGTILWGQDENLDECRKVYQLRILNTNLEKFPLKNVSKIHTNHTNIGRCHYTGLNLNFVYRDYFLKGCFWPLETEMSVKIYD